MDILFHLPNPLTTQIHRTQASGLLDVDAIHTHECIDDLLATVGVDGIAETVSYDLNGHAGFDADAVACVALLGGNSK